VEFWKLSDLFLLKIYFFKKMYTPDSERLHRHSSLLRDDRYSWTKWPELGRRSGSPRWVFQVSTWTALPDRQWRPVSILWNKVNNKS